MKRFPFEVALSVFSFSVVAELLCIELLRGSLSVWLEHPNRRLLLMVMVLVNLLNAVTALYFSARAIKAEVRLQLSHNRQKEAGIYLTRELRGALLTVQNAAFGTNDARTIPCAMTPSGE